MTTQAYIATSTTRTNSTIAHCHTVLATRSWLSSSILSLRLGLRLAGSAIGNQRVS